MIEVAKKLEADLEQVAREIYYAMHFCGAAG